MGYAPKQRRLPRYRPFAHEYTIKKLDQQLDDARQKIIELNGYAEILRRHKEELPAGIRAELQNLANWRARCADGRSTSKRHSPEFKAMVAREYLAAPDMHKSACARAYGVPVRSALLWIKQLDRLEQKMGAEELPSKEEDQILPGIPETKREDHLVALPTESAAVPGTGEVVELLEPGSPVSTEELSSPAFSIVGLFDDDE